MSKTVIVSAGAYRSGSTLQFNILRVIMGRRHGSENVYSTFADTYNAADERPVHVVKVHQPHAKLNGLATHVFTSIRNKLEIFESIERRMKYDETLRPERIEQYLSDFLFWATRADFIQCYKNIDDRPKLIQSYLYFFDFDDDVSQIEKQLDEEMIVPGEELSVDPKTLLHHGHITGNDNGQNVDDAGRN